MKLHHFSFTRLLFVVILSLFVLPAHARQTNKLDQVFNQEMLGVTVRYFESIAGIPRKAWGTEQTYIVDGCTVTAGVGGDSINTLKLDITPECQVNRDSFPSHLSAGKGPLKAGELSGRYYADCFHLCGNAYEPQIYLHVAGYHANNFTELLVTIYSGSAAEDKWIEIMEKSKGEDWVNDMKINCPEGAPFSEIAAELFKNYEVTSFEIGPELRVPNEDCE